MIKKLFSLVKKVFSSRLILDTVILGLGNALQKLVLLLLMPIYTSILTTAEYGTVDAIVLLVDLLVPVITLNMENGVFRFSMDDDCDRADLLRFSIGITAGSGVLALITAAVLKLFGVDVYNWIVWLMFLTYGFRNLMLAYTRGVGKTRQYAICGVSSTFFLAIFNIIFLKQFSMGISGYLLAIVLSNTVSILIASFVSRRDLAASIKSLSVKRTEEEKAKYKQSHSELLKYSSLLIPNSISWWLNSSASRYIILFILGAGVAGIYSASIKIPSIINLLATVFQQAWQYTSTKTRKNEDRLSFCNDIYNKFSDLVFAACTVVVQFSYLISTFVLKKDFLQGWVYVPFLIASSAISTLSVYFYGLFTAEKDSKSLMSTTVIGPLVNIVLCLALVKPLGIWSAVVGGNVSNLVILLMRENMTKKNLGLKLRMKKTYLSLALLLAQSALVVVGKGNLLITAISFAICAVLVVIHLLPYVKMALEMFSKPSAAAETEGE